MECNLFYKLKPTNWEVKKCLRPMLKCWERWCSVLNSILHYRTSFVSHSRRTNQYFIVQGLFHQNRWCNNCFFYTHRTVSSIGVFKIKFGWNTFSYLEQKGVVIMFCECNIVTSDGWRQDFSRYWATQNSTISCTLAGHNEFSKQKSLFDPIMTWGKLSKNKTKYWEAPIWLILMRMLSGCWFGYFSDIYWI